MLAKAGDGLGQGLLPEQKQARPRLAVVTGQAGANLEAMLEVMRSTGNVELIRKPFTLDTIRAFVQSAVETA